LKRLPALSGDPADAGSGPGRLSGLPPLICPSPLILLLGSFPSVASLNKGEYYGFARNHFWFLAAAVFGEPVPASWTEKKTLLARRRVAVWDSAASCAREGSLDQTIRDALPNPVPAFLLGAPTVRRVVLNGSKSAELFARFFLQGEAAGAARIPLSPDAPLAWPVPGGDRAVELLRVPSSSPVPSRAYRTAEDKVAAWKAAFSLG
jgi:TDG/mug DNA glycosylase family protein